MSNFFKILFGSCFGTLLGLALLGIFGFMIVAGLASAGEQKPQVEANSILKIDLEQLPELTGNVPMDNGLAAAFELDLDEVIGLHDLVRTIERAATDDDIKGIYLDNMYQAGGFTKLRAVREALVAFRESGKFVVSFAPSYDQSAYYLATAGDEVYLGPLGILDFRGIGVERMFYKNMLDKLGVDVEVFWAGDFKSATEPFRRTDMSEESKLQTRQYITGMWEYMVEDVATARDLSATQVREYANNITGWKGQAVVDAGLVDGIKRRTEVDARLHELVGFDEDRKLRSISLEDYFAARMKKLRGGNDEVAVLFAEGSISDGKADPGSIGDQSLIKEIDRLAEDDDVKAVVLRVNSGGGSASSSENIWYATEELKARGKPFVVSMGGVAASGGYYIAAGADSIFAEPSTITGSIGVFMMFPVLENLMNEKLGITFDTVNAARHATDFSPFNGISDEGKQVLKQRTSIVYEAFLERVAAGRNMSVEDVRKIAGGRVYLAPRAQEIGLVDRIGDLEDAVATATRMAGLEADDVRVGHYPRIKPPLEQLLSELFGEDALGGGMGRAVVREQLGPEYYRHFELLRSLSTTGKPQAILPELVNF